MYHFNWNKSGFSPSFCLLHCIIPQIITPLVVQHTPLWLCGKSFFLRFDSREENDNNDINSTAFFCLITLLTSSIIVYQFFCPMNTTVSTCETFELTWVGTWQQFTLLLLFVHIIILSYILVHHKFDIIINQQQYQSLFFVVILLPL